MTRVMRNFSVMKGTASATYKEWAAYRSHMALTIVLVPLQLLVQYYIWNSVYSSRSEINGIDFNSMISYFVLTSLIGFLVFDFAEWNLQMLIRTGKLTSFILRPVNHIYFAFCQKIGHRILSLQFEFIPVILISVIALKINLYTPVPGWAAVSILLSFCLMFLCHYALGILAFWFTRNGGLVGLFFLIMDITAGAFFPLTLFPQAIQKILFFLPFQYMLYVPTRVYLGSYELAGISMSIPAVVGLQLLITVLMYFLTKLLWHFGSKRYMGVGD